MVGLAAERVAVTGLLAWLLLALGCAARVDYGAPAHVALVQTTADKVRWYLPAEVATLEPHVWFFDTGYDRTHCDDELVQRLSLKVRGRVRVRGVVGTLKARKARLPPIVIGEHRIEGLTCVVRDIGSTSSIRDPMEVSVAGVLGMDVLRHFRLRIDPGAARITLAEPTQAPELPRPDHVTTLPLRRPLFDPRVRLPVEAVGHRYWAMVDTGAATSALDIARTGLEPARTARTMLRGTGSNGSSVREVAYFQVPKVALGRVTVSPLTVMGRERRWYRAAPPDLLGVDVLAHFVQDYDFRRGRVQLSLARSGAPGRLPQFHRWALEHGPGEEWIVLEPPSDVRLTD